MKQTFLEPKRYLEGINIESKEVRIGREDGDLLKIVYNVTKV